MGLGQRQKHIENKAQPVDYYEKAIVFVPKTVELVELSAKDLKRSFFRKHHYRRDLISFENTLYEDADGNRGFVFTTKYHPSDLDSIYEWHQKFADFVEFFIYNKILEYLAVKFRKYEGKEEYWREAYK